MRDRRKLGPFERMFGSDLGLIKKIKIWIIHVNNPNYYF